MSMSPNVTHCWFQIKNEALDLKLKLNLRRQEELKIKQKPVELMALSRVSF